MSTLLLIPGLVVPATTGWLVVGQLWPRQDWRADELLWRGCLALGAGLGLHSCVMFLWLCLFPTKVVGLFVLDAAMLLFAAGLVARAPSARMRMGRQGSKSLPDVSGESTSLARGASPAANTRLHSVAGWALTLALAAATALGIATIINTNLAHPHGHWDAWMIWNVKARFFFRAGAGWAAGIVDLWPWSHPDYPLLLPLSVARLWEYAGSDTTMVPGLLATVYSLMTVLLLATSVSRLRGLVHGSLAGLLLVATPLFIENGAEQCEDVPVGFYMLAAVTAMAAAARAAPAPGGAGGGGVEKANPQHSGMMVLCGLMGGCAAWTKNEGILFIALMMGAMVLIAEWTRRRDSGQAAQTWRKLALFVVGAAPPLFFLLVMKTMLAAKTDLFVGQSAGGMAAKATNLWRHKVILAFMVGFPRVLTDPWLALGLMGYIVVRTIAAAFSPGRPAGRLRGIAFAAFDPDAADKPTAAVVAIVLGGMLVGLYLVYLWTPQDLIYHLSTSLHRVVIQLWPTFIFLIFLMLRLPETAAQLSGARRV